MSLDDLNQNVGKYTCDRCGFDGLIHEFVEDPASPGLYVHPRCADRLAFNEAKAESPKSDYGVNYFKT